MRYIRILLLHFEHVFEQRLRSLVWFVVTFINPLILILFWRGALKGGQEIAPGWTLTTIVSYYFLVAITGAFLVSHIEEDISERDIQKGELVRYLVKPFPYYWIKLFEETPYRILQGVYGIITLAVFYFYFGGFISLSKDPLTILLAVIIALLAAFISNTFKQTIGLLAFWITDIYGLYEVLYVIHIVFAGIVVPLVLLPSLIQTIANILPFAYIIYYPTIAFIGRLSYSELLRVIGIQCVWLGLLVFVYHRVWNAGIKKFTAIGQ